MFDLSPFSGGFHFGFDFDWTLFVGGIENGARQVGTKIKSEVNSWP